MESLPLSRAIETALKAGESILRIYSSSHQVEYKDDRSPLTRADKASNEIINQQLKDTAFPVISEENRQIPYEERKNWRKFWLIDPLDGTKEFIKRNGEFTVNIALIEDRLPVMGVVYAPALNVIYFASEGEGAFKAGVKNKSSENAVQNKQAIKVSNADDRDVLRVVVSRSHKAKEDIDFIEKLKAKYKKIEEKAVGSALKLCMVAEGAADVYHRYGPTMEWDIAAAHAVLKEAGGNLESLGSEKDFKYNKPRLRNGSFIAFGGADLQGKNIN